MSVAIQSVRLCFPAHYQWSSTLVKIAKRFKANPELSSRAVFLRGQSSYRSSFHNPKWRGVPPVGWLPRWLVVKFEWRPDSVGVSDVEDRLVQLLRKGAGLLGDVELVSCDNADDRRSGGGKESGGRFSGGSESFRAGCRSKEVGGGATDG